MEALEAKILLKNLLKRIKQVDDDCYELRGELTDDEVAALQLSLTALDGAFSQPSSAPIKPTAPAQPLKPVPTFSPAPEPQPEPTSLEVVPAVEPEADIPVIEIDTSVLDLPEPPTDRRLCLDFGTAMSKVTLVKDETADRGYEDIEVLHLGVPGDQEEVSETMLVSSVLIDSNGMLWFGQSAVERSHIEAQEGGSQRLDNIKRYLSEEGLSSEVTHRFNPTDIKITYGDMVLAYLMFLTWSINQCLEGSEEPRNLNRRFAMPCFEGSKARHTERLLRGMLGDSQILADTFYKTLKGGIPLEDFLGAVNELRASTIEYKFVKDGITEPLGVAGSLMSWKDNVNALILVVDVGAGTSDFSLYRLAFNEETGANTALEIDNSSEVITEAGNHLDSMLTAFILNKAGVDSSHENWINIQGNLVLDIRDYKESLFLNGDVTIPLFNGEHVNITKEEFCSLDQVKKFGDSLILCRDKILNRVDQSFIKGAPHDAVGIALTGGGATLPMVEAIASNDVEVQGKKLRLVKTQSFPDWLSKEYAELEFDYPRIAVSLGGARKRIIDRNGVARVTAGDIKSAPSLGGYYTKG